MKELDKDALRQNLKLRRDQISTINKQQFSEAISIRAIRKILDENSLVIASYLSVGSEVNLNRVHHWIWESNRILLIPKIINSNGMKFVPLMSQRQIVVGKFNIPTSSSFEEYSAKKIDAMLIPLVGFNNECDRLGMGGGFYDKFLSNPLAKNIYKIGIGFDTQGNKAFQPSPWDQKLDCVITESKIIISPNGLK